MTPLKVWIIGPSVPGNGSVGGIMLERIYGGDEITLNSVFASDDGIFESPSKKTHSRPGAALRFVFSPLQQLLSVLSTRKRAEVVANHIRENGGADVLIGVTGAVSSLGLTEKVALELRVPWVAQIFDDYIYQWVHPVSRLVASLIVGDCVKRSDAIVVSNEVSLSTLLARKVEREKITILRNPVPDEGPSVVGKARDASVFQLMYTGNIYDAQFSALKNVVTAVGRLGEEGANIKFDLYTRTPKSRWAALDNGSRFVELHEAVDVDSSLELQKSADLLVLPLAFECRYHPVLINTSSPGKFGEYLSSGTPTLVHCPKDSFPSVFCIEHKCAVVVDENSVDALILRLGELLNGEDLSAFTEAALEVSAIKFRESAVRAKRTEMFATMMGEKS